VVKLGIDAFLCLLCASSNVVKIQPYAFLNLFCCGDVRERYGTIFFMRFCTCSVVAVNGWYRVEEMLTLCTIAVREQLI
jgi:hypothetical protein